jgi:23S rRNA pseudouridine1911/1915/1917 synthase
MPAARVGPAMPRRRFVVTRQQAGRALLDVLCAALRLKHAEALHRLRQRQVLVDGRPCAVGRRQVRAGQRIELLEPGPQREGTAPRPAHGIAIRHVDAEVVVVDKPAGLTTVRHADEAAEFGARARRFLPPTLVDLLPGLLPDQGSKRGRLRAVHRLDKETSGLVVLARTPAAERALGQQFRSHGVGRHYAALVRGRAEDRRIESHLVRDRGDGRRGSGPGGEGQHAVTHVRVLERLGDFTLVECRLETGRTHQVRIHLAESGTPLCGERVYDRPVHGAAQPDPSGARRPMLHAASLDFEHPASGKRLHFSAALPRDLAALLRRLRGSTGKRRSNE